MLLSVVNPWMHPFRIAMSLLTDVYLDSPKNRKTAEAVLKIVFISPFSLFDSASGAAQSVRTMLEQLALRGASCHAVTACCFDVPPGDRVADILRESGLAPIAAIKEVNVPVWQGRVRGVEHQAIQFPNQSRHQFSPAEEITFRDTVRIWLAQNRPDIVLTFGGLLLDIEIQRCARDAQALVAFYLANPNYRRPETFKRVDLVLTNSLATGRAI
jgi:hypothetical protein